MQTGKFIILLFMTMLLSGCWNRTELNELWVTTATGVDYRNGQWEVSYQTIVPSAIASGSGGVGSATQAALHVHTEKSKTIHQALNLSNLGASRRIYVAHNRVIFIGKTAAEKGLGQLIDYYFRNSEARETVLMLFTDGHASEMLKKLAPPEKLAGAAYAELITKESELVSIFPSISVYDFALSLHSDAKGIGMPAVSLKGEKSEKNQKELESLDVIKKTSAPLQISLSELAVFEEGRFIGVLNRRESLGLSWIADKIQSTEISFPCKDEQKKTQQASFMINSSNTKLVPRFNGYHYTMQVQVKVDGSLVESACKQDLSKPGETEKLERLIEKQVEKIIDEGWKGTQRLGVDTAGFGDIIHRKFPERWKSLKHNWPAEFKKMDIEVQAHALIRLPGLLQKHL
ncbi:Ger(x)C family spore germination protein [Paenibacillus sp. P96]|uniref:Ger(X)C family spore germination protein n=1 Tax=Paenibacillus zeirhizosphaerae TaxID=2987519 RepID=A0ABT9FUB3_9BACL|nr:Ger(x)C family spore germination protein [Paenibacillus sp. P96]MDP4098210.1 Ger(x)C family spore germination protein [Paenibacillus sp. P96]